MTERLKIEHGSGNVFREARATARRWSSDSAFRVNRVSGVRYRGIAVKYFSITICALCLVVFASLTAIGQGVPDTRSPSKDYNAVNDRSVVILYRNDFFFWGSRLMSVFINGASIGNMTGNTFVRLVAPPGKYTLSATAIGGTSKLTLEAERGKVYFVWLDAQASLPWSPRPQLALVDGSQGKAALDKCDACTEAEGVIKDAQELGLTGKSSKGGLRERLGNLKKLYDDGLISKEEYDVKRKQILEKL